MTHACALALHSEESRSESRFDESRLRENGLTSQIVQGDPFRHWVVRNHVRDEDLHVRDEDLHIYIEGDGTPFAFGRVTRDPTTRSALMLRLMMKDPAPSVYIGRPCYWGLYADVGCSALYWTSRRFSAEVVQSMGSVVAQELERAGSRRAILIAHSGGAAIAVLLAHQISSVAALLTIGANLDTAAWTDMHHYAPLTGSENPILWGQLPSRVSTVHLVGSKDRVTPTAYITRASEVTGGTVVVFDGYTHTCCWARIWPAPLELLSHQGGGSSKSLESISKDSDDGALVRSRGLGRVQIASTLGQEKCR